MIIDIHRHLVAKGWYSEYFWKSYALLNKLSKERRKYER
jgi:hypothetical protein